MSGELLPAAQLKQVRTTVVAPEEAADTDKALVDAGICQMPGKEPTAQGARTSKGASTSQGASE
ncbi:hypothetical protein GCM10010277_09400 [Streptomyces longisporoflavus]|uniref:hypothetical protein n=1 Tax=Streptomyces longisporoflavus TaxID=28044 RepID=UPI00167D9970|nr:hypothetical protein GCM10010277_09400 [Streptomyces longisporoflavus]